MTATATEVATAFGLIAVALGQLYVIYSNTRTKNRIAERDAETANQLALMQRDAKAAADHAQSAVAEVIASRQERTIQMDTLTELNKEAVETAKTAIVTGEKAYKEANGISLKIASYGKKITDIPKSEVIVLPPK